ncbi:MAG: PTS transporter subunit EIIC [Cetobacterium sp.]
MTYKSMLGTFQKLGKVLMAPVLILPIAGILVGIGSGFTNPGVYTLFPFLKNFNIVFSLLKDAGNVVNNNIPVIFSICIAYGFAKSEKATAALSGFLGYMTMNTILGSYLVLVGKINPKALLIGQKNILGVLTLDTGVFGGILAGILVAYIHNRFYKIQLPAILSIFNGTRAVPAISIIMCSFLGIFLSFIFPPIQELLIKSSEYINSVGASGAFAYGLSERLLLPFGLHHFIYLPFFFTQLGGIQEIDGKVYEGAVNIYNAILSSPTAMFDVNITRFVMNGKVLFAMFGLPGAAFAIYKTSKKENKNKVAALMLAAVLPCALMGITEPLEFAFLFVSPVLFIMHSILSGIAYVLTYLLNINIPGPSSFGGPLLSTIFNGVLNSSKGSNWENLLMLGPIYTLMYFYLFKFYIEKKNLKTPGREDELENVQNELNPSFQNTNFNDIIIKIVEQVGGKSNIEKVDACFTRLRISLKDNSKISDVKVFENDLLANGAILVDNGIQIIYGNKANLLKIEMREYLNYE